MRHPSFQPKIRMTLLGRTFLLQTGQSNLWASHWAQQVLQARCPQSTEILGFKGGCWQQTHNGGNRAFSIATSAFVSGDDTSGVGSTVRRFFAGEAMHEDASVSGGLLDGRTVAPRSRKA